MQSIKGNAGNKGGNLTSGFDGGKCESWRPLIGRKTKREGVAFLPEWAFTLKYCRTGFYNSPPTVSRGKDFWTNLRFT